MKKQRLKKKKETSCFLVAQWVKDPALSMMWFGFIRWPRELPHATGMAKKKKKKKKKKRRARKQN